VEHLRIIVAYHAYAGCTRGHHIAAVLKFMNQLGGHLLALVAVTGMERRHPATGLLGIIIHPTTYMLQYLNHVHGGLGEILVDVAGDEDVDNHYLLGLR